MGRIFVSLQAILDRTTGLFWAVFDNCKVLFHISLQLNFATAASFPFSLLQGGAGEKQASGFSLRRSVGPLPYSGPPAGGAGRGARLIGREGPV